MRKVAALLLVVVTLSRIFYSGTFSLGESKTHSWSRSGIATAASATFYEGFCVYPDSHFGKLVRDELRGGGYKVLLLSAPVECDGQFLAVWVDGVNVSYTPFMARGRIKVIAIYSSLGRPKHYLEYLNATNKSLTLMSFVSDTPGEVQAYVMVDVEDSSIGIMGFIGYHDYLRREAAKALVDSAEGIQNGQ